jgi:hypothetical protein
VATFYKHETEYPIASKAQWADTGQCLEEDFLDLTPPQHKFVLEEPTLISSVWMIREYMR